MAIRSPGNPVIRRLGFTLPRLRGIKREGGPAATGIDQFWNAENVVPRGELVPRGGQFKLNPALLPGMTAAEFFNGMFDETVGGAGVGGCGGGGGAEKTAVGDGPKYYSAIYGPEPWTSQVRFFDEVKANPDVTPHTFIIDNSTILLQPAIAEGAGVTNPLDLNHTWYTTPSPPYYWNGLLYFTVFGYVVQDTKYVYGIYSMVPVTGENRPGLVQRFLLVADPGSDVTTLSGLRAWKNKLWFLRVQDNWIGAGAPHLCEVMSWDGTNPPVVVGGSFTGPALPSAEPRPPTYNAVAGDFGDSIYFAVEGIWNLVRRVTEAGVASNMVMPSTDFHHGLLTGSAAYPLSVTGGFDAFTAYKPKGGTEKLYLAGHDVAGACIYVSSDGATFTVARRPPGATDPGDGAFNLAVRGDYLYYSWKQSVPFSAHFIGRYDGTTWTDKYSPPPPTGSGIAGWNRLYFADEGGGKIRLVADGRRSAPNDFLTWEAEGGHPMPSATSIPNY